MKPAFGVELVRPIAKEETRSTDQFIADLFLSAGLPLVHIPSNEAYALADIVHLFQLSLFKVKETETMREGDSSDSAPQCPKCGLVMVLRIHRGSSQAGKRYYGCMNAPDCNGVVEID